MHSHKNVKTLDDATVRAIARRLAQAKRTRSQMRMITIEHPSMTLADAYAVQDAWLDLERSEGRTLRGHKIGLTSKAMQAAVGILEPDFGFLLDDMFFPDAGEVPTERFIQLRIEAELAFVLGKPLRGPGLSLFDVLDATAYVQPALELLDTRIFRIDLESGATRTVRDTICDNAANAGIILGGRPLRPHDQDLRWVGVIVSKNAAIEETGLAASVLGNPGNGIVWLADRLAEHGRGLEAGEVLLSGSFVRPIEVERGDTVHADFGPWGTVACHFG